MLTTDGLAALTAAADAAVRDNDLATATAALNAGGVPTFDPNLSLAQYATLLRAIGDRPLSGTEGALVVLLVALAAGRDNDKRQLCRAWQAHRACRSGSSLPPGN